MEWKIKNNMQGCNYTSWSKCMKLTINLHSIFEIEISLFLISFQNCKWKIKKRKDLREAISHLDGCPCRWAWRWITRRRCCWWATPRTSAPARRRRRTASPARRSSTWWVPSARVRPSFASFVLELHLTTNACVRVLCLQYECQYCQYHVKAQYKKMSSKRAELQSSFSGKAPNKIKGSGGGGLRERLCQDGFHYGGVSSPACAASLWVISGEAKPLAPCCTNLPSNGHKLWFDVDVICLGWPCS